MADDAGDNTLRTLRGEVDRLTTQVERLRGENTRRKEALQAMHRALGVTNAEELRAAVGELSQAGGYRKVAAELAELRKATPEAVKQERDAARSELRSYRHRDAAKGLYGELGVRPDVPPERLMAVMGYKPEADAFDAEGFRARVAELKKTDGYLFGGNATGDAAGGESRTAPPAWSGRGASGQPGGGVEFTEAQLRDPLFMLQQAPKLIPPTNA